MFMVSCLHICPYKDACLLSINKDPKRASGPLEMDLEMTVSYHIHADNQTWAPGRGASALSC